MGTSTTTELTTNAPHPASFIPMLLCLGTPGVCTATAREPSLCKTPAPYTHTGSTGRSRSAPFSSLMCSRLATRRYSPPENITFSPIPGSRWSLLVSVCYGHLWLQCKFLFAHPSLSTFLSYPPSLFSASSRSGATVNVFALQWLHMLLPALKLEHL